MIIGWKASDDGGSEIMTNSTVANFEQVAAMLSEGIAPCHSGEAFRVRLQPTGYGSGVCPVCEFEWWVQ